MTATLAIIDTGRHAKSNWDHFVDYINTNTGIYDIATAGKCALDAMQKIPAFDSHEMSMRQSRVVFHLVGSIAELPDLISCATDFFNELSRFGKISHLVAPSEGALQVDHVARSIFLKGAATVSIAADSLLNFHDLEWLDLGPAYKYFSSVGAGATILSEGGELVDETAKVQKNLSESALSASSDKITSVQKQTNLSLIKIAKCVASIAGSVICLLSMFFAVIVGGVAVFPIASVVLASAWITCKIASHFYQKIVVEPILRPSIVRL